MMRSSRLSLWTGLSLVVVAGAQVTSETVTVVAPPGPPPPPIINTSTINETIIYTCPPIPTVFINVTQYVPVTDIITDLTTATDITTLPVTIYQTIIATTILTTTQVVTETAIQVSPTTATETSIVVSLTTATETSITISPITATATEELLLSTITQRVTSVTLCPTRLVNPSYTALGPYPVDWTWGCPPGWVCVPNRQNCNFEAGTPDRNFICSPNHCLPAPVLPNPLPTWDDTIYGNSTPAQNAGLSVQALDSYFNMDPVAFGLDYQIFVIEETITLTSTTVRPPSPSIGARQAQTIIPGVCYPWCNNCLLEAQAQGKTPALCIPGSAFDTSMEQCEQCIEVHRDDSSGSFVQIAPQFQQFLDYCDQFTTVVVTTQATATMTNGAGSTYSTLTSGLSTTVTLRSSSTSVQPTVPKTSVSTVVATTEIISYSTTTITGEVWEQATIYLPLNNNSTTTIYGSNVTNGATIVLPVAQTKIPYTTTTAVSSVLSGASALATTAENASATGTAMVSQFSGSASGGKTPAENLKWGAMMLWTCISFMFALVP